MAAVSVTIDYVKQVMKRENLRFWDVYGAEGGGVIGCNQNDNVTIDESISMFEECIANIEGDRVKIKASTASRGQKAKDPNQRNQLDTWVKLNNGSTTNVNGLNLKPNDNMLISLLTQIQELKIEMIRSEYEAKLKKEQEDIGHPLDNIAHTVLTDPAYKMAILGALNKISGGSVAMPAQTIPKPQPAPTANVNQNTSPGTTANEKTLKSIKILKDKGYDLNDILPRIAEYELNNPNAINQFIAGLDAMNIKGNI